MRRWIIRIALRIRYLVRTGDDNHDQQHEAQISHSHVDEGAAPVDASRNGFTDQGFWIRGPRYWSVFLSGRIRGIPRRNLLPSQAAGPRFRQAQVRRLAPN